LSRIRGWIDLQLCAMATVALFSGLLLWWVNESWRESLSAYRPIFTSLRQVRADMVRGYLGVGRHLAGESDILVPDIEAQFEQALEKIVDIDKAMSVPGFFGPWDDDATALRAAVAAYEEGLERLRLLAGKALATPDGLSRFGLELHACFAGLEKQADALHRDIQQRIATATNRQGRLNTLLFWLWLAFLLLLGTSLALAGSRRRRAEAAMMESEEKYRSLFEQGMDVILLVAEDSGEILDCNPAVTSEWGYEREALIGRDPALLHVPRPGSDPAGPTEQRYPDGRRAALRESRLVTRSGEIRDVAVRTGFFILGQRPVRLEIFRDVTDRRKGETALAEREAMLRHLGDNLPDGMIYQLGIGLEGARHYLYLSQGVERIFGVDAAAVVANPEALHEAICPEDREVLAQAERAARLTLAAFDVQVRLMACDEAARWAQFRAASRLAPDGTVLFDGVVFDVTAHKRIEESLRQAKVAAEAASQAKTEFLANISHEVRTPLNGVLAMLQLLKTEPLERGDAASVDTALASAQDLVKVLSDILDFSLLESGRLVVRRDPVDCRALVADITRMLSRECSRKGIAIRQAVSGEVPEWIVSDAARLRQILFNVVGNAIKFTEHGQIDLEVSVASRLGQAYALLFTVRDTGIGISEQSLEAIFEPFTQIDGSLTRKHGGTGLGLGIVRRLVDLLDGHILVESEPGQGTEFSFTIRCHMAQAPAPETGANPPPGPPPPGPPRDQIRVLVVEDEAVNRLATVAMLKKLGFSVESVEDGDQVLPALAHGAFDVVLMDIQMPRVSGDEATRRIRQARIPGVDPGIPVIALTAHAMAGDRERYLACGMDAYLSKPVDMAALGETIARACSRDVAGGVAPGEPAARDPGLAG
jgi:PAS domain S-box-containing protein